MQNSQTIYLHFGDKADLEAEIMHDKILIRKTGGGALDFCVWLERPELALKLAEQLENCAMALRTK